MSGESTPPVSLSERTRVRMPLLMLIAVIGSVAGAAVSISSDRGRLDDMDRRLRVIEDAVREFRDVRRDVEWIRRILEQERRE